MARSRSGPVEWFSPDPRAILPIEPADETPRGFRVSKSLQRRVRSGCYRITFDRDFRGVVVACSQPRPNHPETWINREIVEAYTRLHGLGLAHSVEAWATQENNATDGDHSQTLQLVGGLYGVALGGAFFGESMFSTSTDASKVCLVHLVNHLRQRGYVLLDTQIHNDHMAQFGVIEIPRDDYLQRLQHAISMPVTWSDG